MEKALEFVMSNWEFLTAVLGAILGWLDWRVKAQTALERAEKEYKDKKKWAKSKDLYKVAETAYGLVSKIARKTETTLDDKAALGLEKALGMMRKLGWSEEDLGNGEADVILKVFDALHEGMKSKDQSSDEAPLAVEPSSSD